MTKRSRIEKQLRTDGIFKATKMEARDITGWLIWLRTVGAWRQRTERRCECTTVRGAVKHAFMWRCNYLDGERRTKWCHCPLYMMSILRLMFWCAGDERWMWMMQLSDAMRCGRRELTRRARARLIPSIPGRIVMRSNRIISEQDWSYFYCISLYLSRCTHQMDILVRHLMLVQEAQLISTHRWMRKRRSHWTYVVTWPLTHIHDTKQQQTQQYGNTATWQRSTLLSSLLTMFGQDASTTVWGWQCIHKIRLHNK